MSAGRRDLVLSVAFLGLALWLCPAKRAHAQFPQQVQNGTGKHTIWQQSLSPEQVRELLAKFGQADGKEDPFEELVRRLVRDKNPDADPKQVDAAVKRFMNDKEFRNRVMDLAQKQKNQMANNGNNGPPPNLTPQDRAKLAELAKQLKIAPDNGIGQGNGNGGDPFKLPEPPVEFPPFDPRNPQFDSKMFPNVKPDTEFDPDTKFPLDPKSGRPVDPRNGRPIDPKNPPKINPPPPPKIDLNNPMPNIGPKVDPAPPMIDPKTGRPIEQPNAPDDKRRFDPDNPLGVPNDSPEKVAKTKAVEAANALWEKNVGPIDESPAVKRAILDLVSDNDAMDALTDGKGNNFFDFLQNGGGDDEKFGNLFGDGAGGDSGWEWPKFDMNWGLGRNTDVDIGPDRNRERSNWSRDSSSRSRSGPSSFDGLGGFDLGGMTVPWLLVLLLLALVLGAIVWWKWGAILAATTGAKAADGPAPWPIDPREIKTREDVVKAFEFLSVLLCGPGAKTWTHSTIAEELSALAETHGETAVKLARLYELARYAPLDEPLTRAELLEARRLACDLAGIDEA